MRALKKHLHAQLGFPPRFRQRVLHLDSCLEDGAKFDAPLDLQLVLLTFIEASLMQREELLDAAIIGDAVWVESLLQLPMNPNQAGCGKQ